MSPSISEITDPVDKNKDATGLLESNIKFAVYCELRQAVIFATSGRGYSFARDKGPYTTIPDNWGVQLTLLLQVDETGSLTPGISPIASLPVDSFTLGAGATLSSQATHIDKYGAYYSVKDLKRVIKGGDKCVDDKDELRPDVKQPGSSPLLESDLGINKWLQNALLVENTYASEAPPRNANTDFKQDSLSYETRFIIISGASVTTDWKLVTQASVQGILPTASANRTRTHDLIITFGPSLKPNGSVPQLGPAASNSDLASQISSGIATQLRSVAPSFFGQ